MINIISYEKDNIKYNMTLEDIDGNLMINATQLAKPFGKNLTDFTRQSNVKKFISEIESHYGNSHSGRKALFYPDRIFGVTYSVWMCEELALKFAAWLSPSFDIWVQTHIKRLIRTGKTSLNDDKLLSLESHIIVDVQKNNSKIINGKMLIPENGTKGGVSNIVKYNVTSSKAHSGLTPKQLKKMGKDSGLNSRQTSSGKEVLRNTNPPLACAMSLTDNVFSKNNDLTHNDIERVAKVSMIAMDYFEMAIKEGFLLSELND